MVEEGIRPISGNTSGEKISSPHAPHNSLIKQEVVFTDVNDNSKRVVMLGFSKEDLDRLSNWEKNVWGESGREFGSSVGQFDQELSESRQEWEEVLGGNTSLDNNETVHKLREEIADGLISNIGILRHLEPENDEAANFIYSSVYESSKSKKRSTESSVTLYQLKGQKLLDRISECDEDSIENMSKIDKNEIKMMVGSVMKAGFDALEKLNIDTGFVVSDKLRIVMRLKYSELNMRKYGSAEGAKKGWNANQLTVIQADNLAQAA